MTRLARTMAKPEWYISKATASFRSQFPPKSDLQFNETESGQEYINPHGNIALERRRVIRVGIEGKLGKGRGWMDHIPTAKMAPKQQEDGRNLRQPFIKANSDHSCSGVNRSARRIQNSGKTTTLGFYHGTKSPAKLKCRNYLKAEAWRLISNENKIPNNTIDNGLEKRMTTLASRSEPDELALLDAPELHQLDIYLRSLLLDIGEVKLIVIPQRHPTPSRSTSANVDEDRGDCSPTR
ncbi:hypothetical protein BDN72DRAFT_940115 [Pluteus cervinus]|uniref:Uncharacterized protein n=1 Tax=Pluteus cervinus TaxID=181527 RepID=A0ACD3A503_9AGAR|nr:hypothetical protein BDN72DRAFT_940115 [Pluteus cervinus]